VWGGALGAKFQFFDEKAKFQNLEVKILKFCFFQNFKNFMLKILLWSNPKAKFSLIFHKKIEILSKISKFL
jgi:hypothetical protein